MALIRRTNGIFDSNNIAVCVAFILATLTTAPPVLAGGFALDTPSAQARARALADLPPVASHGNRIVVDRSGRKEAGKASIYSHSFDGQTMANGEPYNPHRSIAASKTLPLGTVARVTNLETGRSTEVTIADRGPFINGRVVDLTPHAARAIGLTWEKGIAPVIVAPIAVPQPDGSVAPGAGAAEFAAYAPAEDAPAYSP